MAPPEPASQHSGPHPFPSTSKGARQGTSKGGHSIISLDPHASSLSHPKPCPVSSPIPGCATTYLLRCLSIATGCCPISKGDHCSHHPTTRAHRSQDQITSPSTFPRPVCRGPPLSRTRHLQHSYCQVHPCPTCAPGVCGTL